MHVLQRASSHPLLFCSRPSLLVDGTRAVRIMPPVTPQPDRAGRGRGRRPTVRLPKPRGATASLGIAAVAAILLLILWRSWRAEEVVRPPPRGPRDVELRWKCDGGHVFVAAGQAGARDCWTCAKPAYPVFEYHCGTHGAYDVTVLYSNDASGRLVPSKWRIGVRTWVEAPENLRCLRCRAPLVYRINPLSDLRRRQKEDGG